MALDLGEEMSEIDLAGLIVAISSVSSPPVTANVCTSE